MGEDYAADGSGHQNDLSRYRTPGTHASANRSWGFNSGKDYMVDTDQLKTIAAAMERDLEELETVLRRVSRQDPITTEHVGSSRAGQEFAGLAARAKTIFDQKYQELQEGYRGVIARLYESAGDHQKAEEYTTAAALSVDQGTASAGRPGPTTDSTGQF
jgi:hypothetical protein